MMEPISPEKEGYEYGYAMYKQLPDINVDSSKQELVLSACIIKYKS